MLFNNKNVLRAQSMVWHFVRHSVWYGSRSMPLFFYLNRFNKPTFLMETHCVVCREGSEMSLYRTWRRRGEVRLWLHSFLTSAEDVGEWLTSCTGRFYSWGKKTRYPLIRRLHGPQSRLGRFSEEKDLLFLPRFELCILEPLMWSLYTLGNPGSRFGG